MNTFTRTLATLVLFFAASGQAQVPAAHLEADCGVCHRFGRSSGAAVSALQSEACANCHGPQRVAAMGSAVFHSGNEDRCTSCHSFHAPGDVRIPAGDQRARMSLHSLTRGSEQAAARLPSGSLDLVQCTPCHRNGGPSPRTLHPGHRAAAEWYHRNVAVVGNQSISESCLRCHDRDQQLPAELAEGFDPARPVRTANHVTGVRVVHNRAGGYGTQPPIDPRLPLVNGRIECTTCHDLYSPTPYQLAQFEPRDAMCLGCHVRTIERSSEPGSLALGR